MMRKNPKTNLPNAATVWFSSWLLEYTKVALQDKYQIGKLIAYTDGKVQIIAKDLQRGENVTVLVALSGNLAYEHLILSQFHHNEDNVGIPKLLYFEQGDFSDVLVTSYCGERLETCPSLLESDVCSTNANCILQCTKLFLQIVCILETLHSFNIVHGNVSTSNVCFHQRTRTIYLTGFFKSRFLKPPKFGISGTNWRKEPMQPRTLDDKYAPLTALQRNEPVLLTCRDDLKSAFYVLIEICKKTLAQGSQLSKENPIEIVDIYSYIAGLASSDFPNFHHIRTLVAKAMAKLEKRDYLLEGNK